MVSGDAGLIGVIPAAELALLETLFGAASGWSEAGAQRSDGAAPIVLWVHEAIEGVGVAVVFAAGRESTLPFARLETVRKSPFPTFGLLEGTSLYTSLVRYLYTAVLGIYIATLKFRTSILLRLPLERSY